MNNAFSMNRAAFFDVLLGIAFRFQFVEPLCKAECENGKSSPKQTIPFYFVNSRPVGLLCFEVVNQLVHLGKISTGRLSELPLTINIAQHLTGK